MKNTVRLTLLLVGLALSVFSCKQAPTLPDEKTASKLIQDLIIVNGQMPGGNLIDIHRFEIKSTEKGSEANTAIVQFEIDFTRHPTSGLDPDKYHSAPTRQTENHQAHLRKEKHNWSVQDLSTH
jgi:hypothetical protein